MSECVDYGLVNWASINQSDRNNWRDIAVHMGREISATPSHLSRALYIPHHDATVSHLPIYDVSFRYADTVGDLPIGTSKYTVKLGMMERPRGDGVDNIAVAHNAAFVRVGNDGPVVGTVQCRGELMAQGPEVEVTIDTADDTACSLLQRDPCRFESRGTPTPVMVSHEIPPSKTRVGTFEHPFFTFKIPGDIDMATFQWQIHPVEHGRLRYTLVRKASGDNDIPKEQVCAIYHHIGLGASLSLPHSEGVLLLPPRMSSETEAMVVASTLGFLWRLREMNGVKEKKRRLSFVKSLMKGKE
ncbi:hypothetical protein FE257_011626 [Aspergillus nanangensis]|uniref:Uncharacterized protein n=1 Tax=Aspergillus nanangensis TaxID=2582783 RepID=A0AAD4GZ16_ASPNN|nr:hypothetical protein FE257_011626 [Aspergillus nanangensis]